MKNTLDLGLVQYDGRKLRASIHWELRESENGRPAFTASAGIGNVIGGQCLREVRDVCRRAGKWNEKAEKIFLFWCAYHLNDMNAGTEEQSRFVAKYLAETGERYEYGMICNALRTAGLFTAPLSEAEIAHNPDIGYFSPNGQKLYNYGFSWLYRPIPQNVLEEIKSL